MYPSNRTWTGKGKLGPISCYVKLTPPGRVDKDGHPKRYQYGVNWVESLYPYVEAISGGSSGAWACQTVTKGKTPDTSSTARVSYVMNRNLIERPESVIRSASSLMLVREMDRLVDAELRPTNDSSRNPKLPPIEPFLTNSDSRIGDTNGRIHGAGSNILFADGHVKGFFDSYYPGQRNITKSKCWDSVDKAWYNFSSTAHAIPEAMKRSIAVTP